MKKIWLPLILLAYIGFVIANLILWFKYGRATTFLTVAIYWGAGILAWGLISLMGKRLSKEMQINYKMLLITALISLFAGELVLKYVIKYGLNYNEQNGSIFYISPYQNARRMIDRSQNYLMNYKINTSRIEEKEEFSIKQTYNELGMRERSIKQFPSASADTIIIVGLGDSFTEGSGTQQDSTWLRFLERKINQDTSLNPVFTINLGESGSDPFFEFEKLKHNLSQVKPDLVLLSVNFSDLDDIFIRGGKERFDRPNPYIKSGISPWWEIFYAGSMYIRFFVHRVLDYHFYLYSYKEMRECRIEACQLLADLVQDYIKLGKEEEFKLIVQLHPTYLEFVFENFILDSLDVYLKPIPEVSTFNLYHHYKDSLITKDNYLDYYWKLDMHHNTKGYELWAEELKQFLIKREIIK